MSRAILKSLVSHLAKLRTHPGIRDGSLILDKDALHQRVMALSFRANGPDVRCRTEKCLVIA